MKKMLIPFLGILLFFVNAQAVVAQSDEKKFEIGGQYSSINFTTIPFQFNEVTRVFHGGGGRVGLNPTSRIGLEAEVNFFSRGDDFPQSDNRKQALFGVKIAAWRGKKLAVYGKVRPGVMQLGKLLDCPGPDISSCENSSRYGPALDLGGIVEYNYTKSFFFRFDIGDTLVRHKERKTIQVFPEVSGGFLRQTVQAKTTNNLQLNVGVGFRF
jgi:hypothetical protein